MTVVEPLLEDTAAPSRQSLFALGCLNFFLAGMQTAFGPIAAAYLAAQQWTAQDIGFVLSIGGIASLISQGPGGELLDTVQSKRLLLAITVVTIALSSLIFYLWPSFPVVALAEVLQGITGGVLGPGVVAITLGLVGHAALAERLGQNQRFAAAGPLLLLGFAALPIRAMLFAMIRDPYVLIVTQILDGITGAALGVMTPLVIADVTKGTGRFNLAQGIFGAIIGVGASFSPTLTGLIVHRFGPSAGFVSLAAVGLVAFLVVAVLLPETKQDRKRDESSTGDI